MVAFLCEVCFDPIQSAVPLDSRQKARRIAVPFNKQAQAVVIAVIDRPALVHQMVEKDL